MLGFSVDGLKVSNNVDDTATLNFKVSVCLYAGIKTE